MWVLCLCLAEVSWPLSTVPWTREGSGCSGKAGGSAKAQELGFPLTKEADLDPATTECPTRRSSGQYSALNVMPFLQGTSQPFGGRVITLGSFHSGLPVHSVSASNLRAYTVRHVTVLQSKGLFFQERRCDNRHTTMGASGLAQQRCQLGGYTLWGCGALLHNVTNALS